MVWLRLSAALTLQGCFLIILATTLVNKSVVKCEIHRARSHLEHVSNSASYTLHQTNKSATESKSSARAYEYKKSDNRSIAKKDWLVYTSPYQSWCCSIIASLLISISGILPLFIIPIETGSSLKTEEGSRHLNLLLSFAVGGLLGDVFLHLLPETWAHIKSDDHSGHLWAGLWVIAGIFSFIIAEKVLSEYQQQSAPPVPDTTAGTSGEEQREHSDKKATSYSECRPNGVCSKDGTSDYYSASTLVEERDSGSSVHPAHTVSRTLREIYESSCRHRGGRTNACCCLHKGGDTDCHKELPPPLHCDHTDTGKFSKANVEASVRPPADANGCAAAMMELSSQAVQQQSVNVGHENFIAASGYLNLFANCIDNFTHGLAVGASFLISFKIGVLTTFAILIHEIPHEVGDFAILLRSGFSRWSAAKAQLCTATGSILGAVAALSAESAEGLGDCTAWILPFTAGGFINISLVTVLPDLLNDHSPTVWESIKQGVCIVSGVAIMYMVSAVL